MSSYSSANQERQKLLAQIETQATQQYITTEQLVKDFIKNKKSGIYNYLLDIPKINLLTYTIIFFGVYFFLKTRNFVYQDIYIIFFSFLIIFLINEARRTVSISRMDELKIKLNTIFPKPKYFYMDSGIIEIIHSIKEFKKYNIYAFNNLIKILDNFLSIILDIEKNNDLAYDLFDNLIDFKKAALNNLQSIIFKTPVDLVAENKLTDAIDSLHYILNYYIENVRQLCLKLNKEKLNINSKFPLANQNAEGVDVSRDKYFDIY